MNKDQMLTAGEIERLAQEKMQNGPDREAIWKALQRGKIEGAIKVSVDKSKRPTTTENGGQWRAPAWAALVYLANYRPRKNRSNG